MSMKTEQRMFHGKVVLVTGGNSGIGYAIARRFADTGANVVITGRDPMRLKQAVDSHVNIKGFAADVQVAAHAKDVIEFVTATWGTLDILVNNAGIFAAVGLETATAETIKNVFATNVFGPTYYAQAALPLLKQTHGVIINITSTYGQKAAPGAGHYAASKAALEHLTRSWALEFAAYHVRVNAVAPGPTESEALTRAGMSMPEIEAVKRQEESANPLGRRGNPDDIAHWVLALASPAGKWVTGQVITVDGGFGLA
jgi:NAD(P)-dependent dehydrogenase (short-subunit alcohol dehydrogenase family)